MFSKNSSIINNIWIFTFIKSSLEAPYCISRVHHSHKRLHKPMAPKENQNMSRLNKNGPQWYNMFKLTRLHTLISLPMQETSHARWRCLTLQTNLSSMSKITCFFSNLMGPTDRDFSGLYVHELKKHNFISNFIILEEKNMSSILTSFKVVHCTTYPLTLSFKKENFQQTKIILLIIQWLKMLLQTQISSMRDN